MITINVIIKNNSWKKEIKNPKRYLITKAKKIFKIIPFLKKKHLTFTILLTNSLQLKKLNKKFRKKNKTTDVLSFPFLLPNNLKLKKNNLLYLGDLAISYEIIKRRSKKNLFFTEFDKVWVHGFLHLLGYDHIKNKDYNKMIKIEKKILNLIK
jgi:probable rRNA maturation factor